MDFKDWMFKIASTQSNLSFLGSYIYSAIM